MALLAALLLAAPAWTAGAHHAITIGPVGGAPCGIHAGGLDAHCVAAVAKAPLLGTCEPSPGGGQACPVTLAGEAVASGWLAPGSATARLVAPAPCQAQATATWTVEGGVSVPISCTVTLAFPVPGCVNVVTRVSGSASSASATPAPQNASRTDPVCVGRVFFDDFEAGLSEWSIQGQSVFHDCTAGLQGCSAAIRPGVANTYAHLVRGGDAPAGAPLRFEFAFQVSTGQGDTDHDVVLRLAGGDTVFLTITRGIGFNRGLAVGTSASPVTDFGDWDTPGAWYLAHIHFDPVAGEACATVRDAMGDVVAASPTIAAPVWPGGAILADFEGVPWNRLENPPSVARYDDVRLVVAAPGEGCA